MVLPSSGALTFAAIQSEFGGSNPIGLNEYYAGGTYVPSGTSGTNGPVPSSGAISVRNFYGTSSADYVPNAIDWPNISGGALAQGASRTIQGVSPSITLSFTFTSTAALNASTSSGVFYSKNGGSAVKIWQPNNTNLNQTVTMASGDTLSFYSSLTPTNGLSNSSISGTVNVKNNSNGSTTLDSFT